jgi:protein gp37
MAVMKTHISWTDSTWNPTTGCTKVSAGCENCYAEYIVEKRWKMDFTHVVSHDNRIAAVSKFKPLPDANGLLLPRRVFVNSMSDLMHEQIADSFRDQCFDAMESKRDAVFQVLTKRPMTMRRYVENRYRTRSVPDHIWFGASVEDNRVRGRIDTLRGMKQTVGGCILFLSVEPLLGDPDKHDYRDIDQVLIGGESGVGARDCLEEWCHTSVALARNAGSAVWFKQWGQWKNNPLYRNANGPTHLDRVRQAIRAGEKQARIETSDNGRPVITGEKGGATLGGEVLNEMPPVFAMLTKRLRGLGL